MPATAKSEPRWTRRKHARPEEITAAALESFVERGYAATRLEDVAARAGISKGTLYLYFANKEELFKAVVREALVARLVEFKSQIGKFQGTSTELLRRCSRPGGTHRLHAHLRHPQADPVGSAQFPRIARFVEEVVRPGRGRWPRCSGAASSAASSAKTSMWRPRCTCSRRRC
jgi:AcrR family transcriptional regulator